MERWQGKNLACFPQQKISFAINLKEWDAHLPVSPKSFSSSDLGKKGLLTNVTLNSWCTQLPRPLSGLNPCLRSKMKMCSHNSLHREQQAWLSQAFSWGRLWEDQRTEWETILISSTHCTCYCAHAECYGNLFTKGWFLNWTVVMVFLLIDRLKPSVSDCLCGWWVS